MLARTSSRELTEWWEFFRIRDEEREKAEKENKHKK
jgi:hypothetical protein